MTRIFNYPVAATGDVKIPLPLGKLRQIMHSTSSGLSGSAILDIGGNQALIPLTSQRYWIAPGDSLPITESVDLILTIAKSGIIQLLYDD